jgi:hypothetical protein
MTVIELDGGKSYPNKVAFQRGTQVLAMDKSLNSENVNELITNSKEAIVIGNSNLANEPGILPMNWIGRQAYSVSISNKNEKIVLVPFAEASQTDGDMRVWLPLNIKK